MVVSSSAPAKPAAVGTETPEPSLASPKTSVSAGPNPTPGPNCDLRSRGMGKFPPRLARGPRPKNGPHAHVHLPQLPLRDSGNRNASTPIPPLSTVLEPEKQNEEILTLEMRPARLHVSSLWHRLRFSGLSPMANQRRSTWKPGKPRRGRPEGTKGAGSRSL